MRDAPKMIELSPPHERSTSFVDCWLAVGRDFDGLLTGTVLFTGMPVAFITHPDSNYGEADSALRLPGWQHIVTDDRSQVQCYAHFLSWIGQAGDQFPSLVAEVLARPAREKRGDGVNAPLYTLTPWNLWDAFDEAEDPAFGDPAERGTWMDDGHAWCGFGDFVDSAMHAAYPDEWERPREWCDPSGGWRGWDA